MVLLRSIFFWSKMVSAPGTALHVEDRLCKILLRALVIVDEANQAMLHQLDIVDEANQAMLRALVIVDEANQAMLRALGHGITNQAMLHQLDMLRKAMNRRLLHWRRLQVPIWKERGGQRSCPESHIF